MSASALGNVVAALKIEYANDVITPRYSTLAMEGVAHIL